MTRWRVTLGCAVLGVAAAACSGGDDTGEATTTTEATSTTSSPTTTVPERPTSTTTTAFDPASVEGQIEAAYLRSWDVYAEAVYNLELDEAALAGSFAGDHLETKRDEIKGRIEDGRASLVRVEHDYTIQVTDPVTAVVVDQYRNHQVLIDPETKAPIEDDPDEQLADLVTLNLSEGSWRVVRKERL